MNGAKDGEDYDGFGIYLTPENVDDYLNQRRSDWRELKAEFEETGDVALPGMDDESYIRESDPVI